MAERLRALGFEVTEKVGGYGVVGVLKNGDGPTVLVRADMDALPVEEKTGLPYASKVRVTDATRDDVRRHARLRPRHPHDLLGRRRDAAGPGRRTAGAARWSSSASRPRREAAGRAACSTTACS